MNWNVQTPPVNDITSKWELAQRMSNHAELIEQTLKALFEGAMQGLEIIANTTFQAPMKERVWSAISKEKLKTLHEFFILQFCEQILGSFTEDQTKQMLEEHKRTGAVKNGIYCVQLQIAYDLNEKSIRNAVFKQAKSMKDAWIPEIVELIKKEGVQLPEPKRFNKTRGVYAIEDFKSDS